MGIARLFFVIAGAVVVACGDGSNSTPTSPATPSPTPTPRGFVILAVGDVGWPNSPGIDAVRKIVEWRISLTSPGRVFFLPLGDLAYPNGTETEYLLYYDLFFRSFKQISRPVPGNHDYDVPRVVPYYYTYYRELLDQLAPDHPQYYSYRADSWFMVALVSDFDRVGRGLWERQLVWLRDELQKNTTPCAIAYWHHPRFTSSENGDTVRVGDFWQVLQERGVEVNLVAHDHVQERFVKQNSREEKTDLGIRQFTSGGGGAPLYRFPRIKPNSEFRSSVYAVLELELFDGRYTWKYFSDTSGKPIDEGQETCH